MSSADADRRSISNWIVWQLDHLLSGGVEAAPVVAQPGPAWSEPPALSTPVASGGVLPPPAEPVVPEVMQVLADDEPYDDSDAVCQRCDVPCMYDDECVVVAGGASYPFCVKCYPGAVQWMAEMAAARAASGQLTGPVATNGAVLQ
jgi:hypothetical protein